MKLKMVLLLCFILLNIIIYSVTELNKKQRINSSLNAHLEKLDINYKTLKYQQNLTAKAILQSTKNLSMDILSKIPNASKSEKDILRKELYERLIKKYEIMKTRGIYQYQFVLPNNKTFLRVHKPEKYNDDLTGIRYSYEYTNKTKKSIQGFEGGKTTHAFRYVQPIFDEKGNYICAMEVSFSSLHLQDYLTDINKLHSHFLVNKNVFSTEVWERNNLPLNYQQSEEHDDFMLIMTGQHTAEKCIIDNKKRLSNIKYQIKQNIAKGIPFSLYTTRIYKHNYVDVISFIPIKSTKGKNSAWIVSYENDEYIMVTLRRIITVRSILFILLVILFYFIYRVLNQKSLLEKLVDEKTVELNKKNKNLELINASLKIAQKIAHLGFWELDLIKNELYWGDEVYNIFNTSKQETKPSYENFLLFVHPDDRKLLNDEYTTSIQEKQTYHITHRLVLKDGTIKHVEERCQHFYDEDGNPVRSVGSVYDITEEVENSILLKEKVNELGKQKELYDLVFDNSPYGVLIIDTKTNNFVNCNNKVLEMLQYDSKDCIYNIHPSKLSPKLQPDGRDSIEKANEIIELAMQNGTNTFEWKHIKSNDAEFWVEVTLTSIKIDNKDMIHVGWKDIDDRKKAEEKLKELNENLEEKVKEEVEKNRQKDSLIFEQSKLVAMGEMIGNIAHQWRQPLSVISTASSGMQMQKEYDLLTDKKFDEACDAINLNAKYLSDTIDDFRGFIIGDRKRSIFNLKDAVNSFMHLVEGSIKNHNIHMVLDLEKDIKVDGYQNELIQCLINVFHNAKEVLKQNKKEDNRFIFINTEVVYGKIVIKFTDNGDGIDEDIINKIFEPYFTTKHKSQGTGLGLHMTYNLIVDGMNGTIEAHNKNYEYDGKNYTGAEFTIILPLG